MLLNVNSNLKHCSSSRSSCLTVQSRRLSVRKHYVGGQRSSCNREGDVGDSSAGCATQYLPGEYPRTPHLPFSPQVASDDVKLSSSACNEFIGQQVVITEKLDGGNCCICIQQDEAGNKEGLAMVSQWSYSGDVDIPPHIALFGENMAAVHSIAYDGLISPFYLFAVWDGQQRLWLSWEEVEGWAQKLGVPTTPVIMQGTFSSLAKLSSYVQTEIKKPSRVGSPACACEGFVIRVAGQITEGDFSSKVAKYVRKGHIQTDDTWRQTWKEAPIPGPAVV